MDEYVISPIALNQLIQTSSPQEVCILDCRFSLADAKAGKQAYLDGHIPGAHYCDLEEHLSAPVCEHGGRHPLPTTKELTAFFASCGINSTSQVIVYDDSKMAFASRCWWLLKYMGHDSVKILNGGYSAWTNFGLSMETSIPSKSSGSFSPAAPLMEICNLDEVKQKSTQSIIDLIDSREKKRYLGEEEPIDPVAGHIPGAACSPWQLVTNEKGEIQDQTWHNNHWDNLISQNSTEDIIVYCGSGVTACVNIFSMTIAGLGSRIKLYPGSWSDWCSYPELPVARKNV